MKEEIIIHIVRTVSQEPNRLQHVLNHNGFKDVELIN